MLNYLAEIAAWNLFVFTALLAFVQVVLYLAGFRQGRHMAQSGKVVGEGVKIVSAGILGLTAFVLALTLSFSMGRLSERRIGAIEEANAIGTAWLQAQATNTVQGQSIAAKFETYAALRRESLMLGHASPRIAEIDVEVTALQSAIWSDLAALLQDRSDAVTASLMNAINHSFDMTTAERIAVSTPLPPQLILLLLLLVFLGMGMIGIQLGFVGSRHTLLSVLLVCVWTYVVVLILDFGNPRIGAFRTPTAAFDMTISGFSPPP